jgi:putative endonuclease
MNKCHCVYILASKRNGTLYTGVTSNLPARIYQHKEKLTKGFTERYDVSHLVYYEIHSNAEQAITREKQIKTWKRDWKIKLIEEKNPTWDDLYESILA